MFKFLKGVVGGSGAGVKDLPYNIGDPYPSAWGSWSHFHGTSKVIQFFDFVSQINQSRFIKLLSNSLTINRSIRMMDLRSLYFPSLEPTLRMDTWQLHGTASSVSALYGNFVHLCVYI